MQEDESGRVSVLGARGARGLVLPVVSITIEEESSSSVIRGALEFMQGHKVPLGEKKIIDIYYAAFQQLCLFSDFFCSL